MSLPNSPAPVTEVPVAVKLVNLIIRDGVGSGASEIIFEAGPGLDVVQFRIDGILSEHMRVPSETMPRLLRRIAVLSRLFPIKPAERQEGMARVRVKEIGYELGVTFTPTPAGTRLSVSVRPLPEAE